MDKPHLTFRILSRLNLLLSPSDLLIKLFYMSHGHDLSLKVTVAPSISVFKSRLKTHLYSMAFP